MNRRTAIASGLTTYAPDNPCAAGHRSRAAASGHCTCCRHDARVKAGQPPLRAILSRGAGSTRLVCGHVVNTPKNRNTRSCRCPLCMGLEEWQRYINSKAK